MCSQVLTNLLLRWQSSLGNKPTQPWLQRANSRLRRSKWSQGLILAWMVRCAADMVLAMDAEAIRVPLRYFTGMYACVFVVRFFRRRGAECSAILLQLATASAQLEEGGCPETKKLLDRSARLLRRTGTFYTVFRTTQIFGVIQSSVVYHSDSAAAARLDSFSPNLTTIVYIFNATAMVLGLVAFYQMQTLVYVLFGSCAVLWRALGHECEQNTAGGSEALCRLAALHALLLQAARSSRLLLAGLLFQWLPVILVLPLLATVELIVAFKVDLLALTCFTVIGTIFVPVCITGQMLEDTSAALSDRLYSGPWVEECWKTRRLRLQFMAGATRRANLAVQGLGSLNAPTCLEAIRRWFGFINVLLNLQY